ncbi:hypothetical protein GPECTOR_68g375 [Gonium pectorale]|uniref:Uncharacterized protein n=1 Tax=Gonium pectorale TaxID=33097 RepID=A0A150G3K2_GONPE|nr:hypothetical protein GPECTOR_68g375 [Gonium pectorale]|eukprot:KXZ44404.1 hypothetical protein GPECTOR_68g375 [Gonium pectorale]
MIVRGILLLLTAGLLAAVRHVGATPGNYKREDLAVAFPTHAANVQLVEASRAWRRGLKTLVVVGDGVNVESLREAGVPPAVLQLLNRAGLNADDPHLLHDFLMYFPNPSCQHQQEGPINVDRRCLPCPAGARSCLCLLPPGCRHPDNWNFQECSYPARVLTYGGVGVIYSVGLLRRMAADPSFYLSLVFRDVVPSEPFGGGQPGKDRIDI